ncbi:MAG: purine-nucleoside phosphorylase [Myxococcota bacterium]|jgi:purine-nucleoside phosphorylase|nr:purine-nucleoside phosphorylase [Myxococcota bacterium]
MSEADVVEGLAAQMLEAVPSLARCRVALVLGSGLGAFADTLEDPETVSFSDLDALPSTGVPGHSGQLVVGRVSGSPVAIMQGRVHLYEGHGVHVVVRAVRALAGVGIEHLVLTNAAGAIRGGLTIGDLVMLTDHLNLTGGNPMVGVTDTRLGRRFLDTTDLYSSELRDAVRGASSTAGVEIGEGVYAALLGPTYETPAEIRMLGRMGADLVGMSTVLEAMAAHALGVRVLAMSFVTNIAAGLASGTLSHGEVTDAANAVEGKLTHALGIIVQTLDAMGEAPR